MSGIGTFVSAFCAACVLLGGLYLLCPSGKLEKSVKYVFGLALLVSVLAAVTGMEQPDFRLPESGIAAEAADDMGVAAAECAMRLALEGQQIKFSKLTVCTDNSADGSIVITKVIVRSRDSAEKIRLALGAQTGAYEVEIIDE